MNLSKLNRVTHRDIGYLIAGLTIIYALSGIALNHKNNWNPNYIIDNRSFKTDIPITRESFNNETAAAILKNILADPEFKTFHLPTGNKVTIFIDGGFVQINALTGEGVVEKISKRPLFYQINFPALQSGQMVEILQRHILCFTYDCDNNRSLYYKR